MNVYLPMFFYKICLQCGRYVLTYANSLCPECCGKAEMEQMRNLGNWRKQLGSNYKHLKFFLRTFELTEFQSEMRSQLLGMAETYARFDDLSWKLEELQMADEWGKEREIKARITR